MGPVASPSSDPIRVLPEALRADLEQARIAVVTDPEVLTGHAVDWSGRWTGPVLALVRPRSTEQVAAALAAARVHRVPVQVQGGNTGLVGGSIPDRPSLLLLTTGLDTLGEVDELERTVVVGAGVTLGRLQAHARAERLRFGVDLAARDSATVGGMAATNAGGLGVCAFGMMRDNVRGVTAVLADGRVVRTVGRPRKDNSGYDLRDLLIGNEGTLGVITEVEVQLHPEPTTSSVALLANDSLTEAVGAARAVQAAGLPLLAAEVVDGQGVARAASALALVDPLPPGTAWMLLIEVADGGIAEAFAPVADAVVAVATTASERDRLWSYREHQTELYARLAGAVVEKLDVSLRLGRLDEGLAAVRQVLGTQAADGSTPAGGVPGGGDPPLDGSRSTVGVEPPDAPWLGVFGHALDGNLHLQLVGAAPGTVDALLAEVTRLGGSVSAEHGIGRLKAPHLHLARSADEIAWMRQLRATVDPDGLLNPGIVLIDPLDDRTRSA